MNVKISFLMNISSII